MTLSPPIEPAPTLLSAPIELADDWGHMLPRSADLVVEHVRHSCLDGVRLLSDRQPTRLRVDEHTCGPPTVSWIIVDIGERAWSQLAYRQCAGSQSYSAFFNGRVVRSPLSDSSKVQR
jgi:hypothetical protein